MGLEILRRLLEDNSNESWEMGFWMLGMIRPWAYVNVVES
jgi:hypothetical protein